MQGRIIMLAVAVVLTAGCTKSASSTADTGMAATAAAPAFDMAAAETEIKAGDSSFFAAVRAKDANAVAATYSNDAVSMPPGMPAMRGQDAIRKGNEEFLKTPGFAMTGETESVKFSDDGTMAYATGKYTATYNDAKGKPVTEDGKYLEVLQKVDGKWKVIADAYNANSAPKM